MAQYKTIPSELLGPEIARKSYLDYERGANTTDEATTEAEWIAERKKLYEALEILTPRQREVFVLKVGHRMSEGEIAKRLKISQSAVSQFYSAARKKMDKLAVIKTKRSL